MEFQLIMTSDEKSLNSSMNTTRTTSLHMHFAETYVLRAYISINGKQEKKNNKQDENNASEP